MSYSQLKRRLQALNETELVTKNEDLGGGYQITELGIAYTEGDVSKERLEEMDPETSSE